MSAGSRSARLESFFNRLWLGRGPIAWALLPVSWVYGALIGLRRAAYARGLLPSTPSAVPVIVVGNRSVGGAGKTPTVLALVDHLQRAGWHPGIVSRGHGRSASDVTLVKSISVAADVGDEPALLFQRSGLPVAVGRTRSQAAAALIASHPAVDCIVADDGLQHLEWARDVEIVVFDARGAGNGWLLPAGPLREPIDAPRAGRHQICLYSAGVRSTPLPGFIAQRSLRGVVPLAAWRGGWSTAELTPLEALQSTPLHACAAIAQPHRFFDMLREHGLTFEPHALPDHDNFSELPWPNSATDVIVTEKDAIKLDPERLKRERPQTRTWVAPLDFQPEPAFWAAIDHALGAPPPPAR